MGDKGRLTEEQLKKMLLVANVVIGAPITEESKDEASTCFERQGTTNCSQQHQITRYQHRNRLMVMLSYCAGLRACEIASLRIGDVIGSDGEARHTILLERWQTKGTQRQQAVVSEKLRKEITSTYGSTEPKHLLTPRCWRAKKVGLSAARQSSRCFASCTSKLAWMGRAATVGVAPCSPNWLSVGCMPA